MEETKTTGKIAIVVPMHIPPTKDWMFALQREAKLGNADVIIVDDSDGKLGELPPEFQVYGYDKQKEFLTIHEDLYTDFADIFHKSSACRVFGHILAYSAGYDIVIGLDSDCVVPFYFVQKHITLLNAPRAFGWTNPLGGSGLYSRGYPYSKRNWPIKANMGMWDNVLDLNGKDRKPNEPKRVNAPGYNIASSPLPFSGMNFVITRDVLFGFLFLPNFDVNDDHFRRIDDVWGGYIFQKLLHKLQFGVTYGQPVVFHDTVVVPEEDTADEEAMYKHEDKFTQTVDNIVNAYITNNNSKDMNELMTEFAHFWDTDTNDETMKELTPAFIWWGKVIKNYGSLQAKT